MNIIYDLENAEEFVTEDLLNTMEKAALLALERENIKSDNVELSLTFVDSEEIKNINLQFRNINSATDVLSFPQYESIDDIDQDFEVVLGDVVICSQVAKEQAKEFGHSIEREMVYLFVHSIFHLLGYDHMIEEDKVKMRAAEEEVLGKLNITRDNNNTCSEEYKKLYDIAADTLKNSYAPYSKFKVGAAILTMSGEIFTGVNVENSSYGASICAERTAVCKCVSEGNKKFKAIAVAGYNEEKSKFEETWPCGICRQFLFEFNDDIDVITGDSRENLKCMKLSELLVKGFLLN